MRLQRIRLENYRSHEALDLDLESVSCAAIIGPNGAGKSSILSGINWCLFGTPSADDVLRRGTDKGGVTLTMEAGHSTWRISRGRKRGSKSWLVVEQETELGWEVHPTHTVAEAERLVGQILGIDEEAFQASVYAPQGQAGLLAGLSPGARKALLGGLLGLESYEEWREAAAGEERAVRERVEQAQATLERDVERAVELEERAGDLGAMEEAITGAEEQIQASETELDAAIEREKAVEQVRRRAALVREAEALVQRSRRSRALEERRRTLEAALADTGDHEDVPEQRERVEALREQKRERATIEEKLERRRADLTSAESEREKASTRATSLEGEVDQAFEADTCPTCGQELKDHAEAAKAKAYEPVREAWQRVKTLDDVVAGSVAEIGRLESDLGDTPAVDETELRSLALAVEDLQTQLDARMRTRGQLEALDEPEDRKVLKAEHERIEAEAGTLPERVPEGPDPARVRRQLEELRERKQRLEIALREGRGAIEQARQLRAEAAERRDRLREDESRRAALRVVAGAFSRNGIPAMILDNAVAGIEQGANEALEQLGSAMRIELRTQMAKRSGKGMTETLEIVVDDGAYERPLGSFSGGEQYRVHVALRLGIARALTAGSGKALDVLLIDEPTDLDSAGVSLLADLLTRIDRQVLLVTHQDELVDAMPQKIIVERPSDAAPSKVRVA